MAIGAQLGHLNQSASVGSAAGSSGGYGSGYVRVRQRIPGTNPVQYKIVRVHQSKLTPGQLAAAQKNGLNGGANASAAGGAQQGGQQPGTNTLAGGGLSNQIGAVKLPAPTTIDPRDGSYMNELARLIYDRDRATAEIDAERAQLPSLYNRGAADIATGYNRGRYDSNAELASRGIVRSGEFQRRGADALMQRARQTADLERQYGTGAQAALAQRLNDIQTTYNLGSASALQSAKDRYAQNNPASTYIWQNVGG